MGPESGASHDALALHTLLCTQQHTLPWLCRANNTHTRELLSCPARPLAQHVTLFTLRRRAVADNQVTAACVCKRLLTLLLIKQTWPLNDERIMTRSTYHTDGVNMQPCRHPGPVHQAALLHVCTIG